MGLTDRIIERLAFALSQIRIERVVFVQIEIRHIAEEGRCRRLAVAINQEDTIAADRQILRHVDRDGRLADTTLEVLDRDDGTGVAWIAPWPRSEGATHVVQLSKRVSHAPTALCPRRWHKTAIALGLANRSGRPPHQIGGLSDLKRRFSPLVGARTSSRVAQLFKDRGRPSSERRNIECFPHPHFINCGRHSCSC